MVAASEPGNADPEVVDRLRRAYAAFNRGDFEAAIAEAHPSFEFVRDYLGRSETLRGADAFREWMEPEAFGSQLVEVTEIRPSGRKVLVRQEFSGRGASSGIEISRGSWAVWTFNEAGEAIRLEVFVAEREEEAFRAAGLDAEQEG